MLLTAQFNAHCGYVTGFHRVHFLRNYVPESWYAYSLYIISQPHCCISTIDII